MVACCRVAIPPTPCLPSWSSSILLYCLKQALPLYMSPWADHCSCLKAVKHLLEASAEPSVAAGGGATALHAAASAGHLAIVEALIQAGADVDIQVTITSALNLWVCTLGSAELGYQALMISR